MKKTFRSNQPREDRPHTRYAGRSGHGTSTVEIVCPFCGTEVEAYIWSLAGGGKKCPECGAIHYNEGFTRKYLTQKKKARKADGEAQG